MGARYGQNGLICQVTRVQYGVCKVISGSLEIADLR
jgi:hypothetical protein